MFQAFSLLNDLLFQDYKKCSKFLCNFTWRTKQQVNAMNQGLRRSVLHIKIRKVNTISSIKKLDDLKRVIYCKSSLFWPPKLMRSVLHYDIFSRQHLIVSQQQNHWTNTRFLCQNKAFPSQNDCWQRQKASILILINNLNNSKKRFCIKDNGGKLLVFLDFLLVIGVSVALCS